MLLVGSDGAVNMLSVSVWSAKCHKKCSWGNKDCNILGWNVRE